MSVDLSKPFIMTGEFFLPDSDNGYRGTITYDPTKGLFLSLKNLPLSYQHSAIKIMTCIIDDNPYSGTLVNIIPQTSVFSGNRDGLTRTNSFVVDLVFFGKRFSSENELLFNKVRFIYSNFREWLNKPNIPIPYTEGDTIATIKELPAIEGNLDDAFDFQMDIQTYGSFQEKSFDISLRQGVTFSIISKKGELPIIKYLQMNKIIKYFFMFLQGRYVSEENIFCEGQKEISSSVELVQFYRRTRMPEKLGKNEEFAHTYNVFKFEKSLQKWIEKYNEMPDFFDRFFENTIKDIQSPIDRFENLYQTILSYQNYKFPGTIRPKEEYIIFFNSLQNKLEDEKDRQFVERFRPLGNLFSPRQQLDKVFEQLDYLKDKKDRDSYVNGVIELRNRIEHATENISPILLGDASRMEHNLNAFISGLMLFEIEYDRL